MSRPRSAGNACTSAMLISLSVLAYGCELAVPDVPAHFSAVIATWNAPSTYHEGSGILEEEGMLTDPTEPGSASAGIQVGIQVRAWEREKKRTLSDYEEL